ncbi:MAG TPA: hypothetical protein VFN76_08985, partial [Candidatus Limnocylindria bacterium]|nr:hypothetical protein [Candidatus Limnocylindria bacterium]
MSLAVHPPLAPMLARLVRELPIGDYVYEPKWDGFRAICFRDGDDIEIQSRHGRPMARYFPELVDALWALSVGQIVLDGEIVVVRDGHFDFPALMLRTHRLDPNPTGGRGGRLRHRRRSALPASGTVPALAAGPRTQLVHAGPAHRVDDGSWRALPGGHTIGSVTEEVPVVSAALAALGLPADADV